MTSKRTMLNLCLLAAGAAAVAFSSLACRNGDGFSAARKEKPAESDDSSALKKNVFLCMGDSLTAGYGVAREEAWPGLLEADLKTEGISLRVRNAGTSGLTSAGAIEALSWQLSGDILILFLAIGANDGLRGLDLGQSRKNISSIVREAQVRGVQVVLAGMKIPPNYGPAYAKRFEAMYVEIAREHRLKLMPFLLEGVAGRPRYNLEDGIHPNAEGHRLIAGNVLAFLKKEKVLR